MESEQRQDYWFVISTVEKLDYHKALKLLPNTPVDIRHI